MNLCHRSNRFPHTGPDGQGQFRQPCLRLVGQSGRGSAIGGFGPFAARGLAAIVACGLVAMGGCGKKPQTPWGTASGKVSYGGQPVTQGIVVFENREMAVARMTPLDAEGKFVQRSIGFEGLPVGTYAVAIQPQQISDGGFVAAKKSTAASDSSGIPPRYRSTQTSGLSFEVREGRNPPVEFDLTP
jgi:hypothetical protein